MSSVLGAAVIWVVVLDVRVASLDAIDPRQLNVPAVEFAQPNVVEMQEYAQGDSVSKDHAELT